MNTGWTRRGIAQASVAAIVAAGLRPRYARGAGRTLNILCHRVHQLCLTTGVAGNLTEDWKRAHAADLSWTTFDTDPLQDRLFREAHLSESEFGVGYLVNSRATDAAASVLLPLDAYQAKAPVEEFGDIAPGLVQGMTVNGKLIGIPVRHATQGLFYNEAILQSRGITAPPTTLEELVDMAKRCTFRADDGRQVTGMVLASDLSVFPVAFARAFGGDFVSPELKLVPDPAPLERGIAAMRAMYDAGALPRSFATTTNEDQVTWLQQGRAAFTMLPFARFAQLNSEEKSRYPGRIKAVEFPASETLRGKGAMAGVTEFWAMSIPANATDKELGWSFIRAMSSKAVTVAAARNGNGPVRLSTYREPSFASAQPLADVEAKVLATARVPLPAFPEAVRAQSILLEEVQLAVLGRKTPQEAVAAVQSRVRPLLPA